MKVAYVNLWYQIRALKYSPSSLTSVIVMRNVYMYTFRLINSCKNYVMTFVPSIGVGLHDHKAGKVELVLLAVTHEEAF